MTTFRYRGNRADGTECSGDIEAASETAAGDALAELGITASSLVVQEPDRGLSKLTPTEAAVVNAEVRDLLSAGLPLSEGLRAAADELAEPGLLRRVLLIDTLNGLFLQRNVGRIRAALIRVADDVAAGKSLEEALHHRSVPDEVDAVLKSGVSSQSAAIAIGEYSSYVDSTARLRNHVMFLFAYPLFAISAAIAMIGIFFCFLVPAVGEIFDEFDTELPALTQFVVGISDMLLQAGPRAVIIGPILLTVSIVVFIARGKTWARKIARALPLWGQGFRSLDLARTAHVLAVVLRHNAPIPGALRAAGAGSGDREIAAACEELALTVESGNNLPNTQPSLEGLPLSFLQVAQDGSDRNTVADALHAIANMFEQRARTIMALLAAVVQPIVVLGVCFLIGLCFYSLFLPVIKLLNDLG